MRRPFRVGFAGGSGVGLVLALMMDVLAGKTAGLGWAQAAASDINRTMQTNYSTTHPWVIAAAVLGIGFMALLGGVMGGAVVVAVDKFFKMLKGGDAG